MEEEDGSISDAGSSSHEDESDSREDVEEEGLEEKIKWFFMACEEEKEDKVYDDHLNQSCTIDAPMHTGDSSEQNFSSVPIDSDTHFTNEHSALQGEPVLLSKRNSRGETDSTSGSSYKKQRISLDQQISVEQTIIEISDSDDSIEIIPCIFPQFAEALKSEKKRDLK